ncbi:MAG: acyl carrier protein [Candidatus Woesearchaeota archaeon]
MEKLIQCFAEVLMIKPEEVNDSLEYSSKGWDSVAHMAIISSIEEAFDIMIDTEDVIAMSSFAKAKEILKKYGIEIDA